MKEKQKEEYISYNDLSGLPAIMGRIYNGYITVVKPLDKEQTEWMVYRVKMDKDFIHLATKTRKGISSMRFWKFYYKALSIIKNK